ncbi:MAG: hypothetical protein LBB45_06375 [Methanobrevibacter sp.]|jgi:hypothetical protein|nr:hypothetical protein [Candidatus Methanovirga basalitermitum]
MENGLKKETNHILGYKMHYKKIDYRPIELYKRSHAIPANIHDLKIDLSK